MLLVVNTEKDSPETVRAACRMLCDLVGLKVIEAGQSRPFEISGNTYAGSIVADMKIAPEDEPATGLPPASEAFAGTPPAPPAPEAPLAAPDPAAVFGGGAPPTPPAASTPAAPPAPPAGTASAGPRAETDADGLPHDPRIHSKEPKKNADGRWRARKGLNDAALVKRVQDELRALMALPVPSAAPAAPAAPSAPAAPAAPTPTAPPAPPAPPGTPVEHDPTNFASFMPKVTFLINTQKLTMAQVVEACKSVGIEGGLALLAPRADLIPAVWAQIQRMTAQ